MLCAALIRHGEVKVELYVCMVVDMASTTLRRKVDRSDELEFSAVSKPAIWVLIDSINRQVCFISISVNVEH
jgi:hypothetical protein